MTLSDIDYQVCCLFNGPAQGGRLLSRTAKSMLVCHCNVISEREIEGVILGMLEAEPWQLIVPAMVYRALETRGRCCGCVTNIVDIIARVTEKYHLQQARTPGELIDVRARLDALKKKRKGGRREGRTTNHRAA